MAGFRPLNFPSHPGFGRPAVRCLLIVAAVLLVLFCRRPDAFLKPQFWAEDFVFLIAADQGGFATLGQPQAGYLQLIPRLVAWPAKALDPALQPGFYMAGWIAVTLAVVFGCFSSRQNLPLKSWLAAAMLIVPHSGEVFLNLTNSQWISGLGILLIVFKSDPTRLREWIVDLGLLFCAGLSGPFIIAALPLFAARAARRKSPASEALFALSTALAVVQASVIAHTQPVSEFTGPFRPWNLLVSACVRFPGDLFFGPVIPSVFGPAGAIALAGGVLLFLGYGVYRGTPRRSSAVAMLGFALGLLALSAARVRFDLWPLGESTNGDRYFFIPKIILLWLAGLVAVKSPIRWIKWGAFALLGSSIVINAPRFRFQPYTDYHWYAQCIDIRARRELEVTVNPGWRFKYRRGSPESTGPF